MLKNKNYNKYCLIYNLLFICSMISCCAYCEYHNILSIIFMLLVFFINFIYVFINFKKLSLYENNSLDILEEAYKNILGGKNNE